MLTSLHYTAGLIIIVAEDLQTCLPLHTSRRLYPWNTQGGIGWLEQASFDFKQDAMARERHPPEHQASN